MMYSVMLVDNEPIIPKGLMKLIDWRSCDCQISAVARDGIDAVRQIREQAPDILITDIRMPEMDGLQLCAWVREHCPRTQIILLTGFPDFEYAQQAIQYQVAAFVLKPTTEDALTEALNKACRLLEKDGSAAAEQRNLLLEQQLLLGEMIFHNRHSLLYTLTRLNALHIQLDNYYVLSMHVLSREETGDVCAMLQEAQRILCACAGERKLYLISRSDNCCSAVLQMETGQDPQSICVQAVEEVDRNTDFVLRLVESALENRSRDAAAKNLEELFTCMHQAKIPFSGMQQIGRLLHSFCTSLLLSHNLSDGSLPEDYAALHCETPAELETELRTVVRETLLRVGRTPDNIDSIIYEVKQYIDENYSMNLSLDLLAAQVHLSPSYFSKLFKREMGENFSTYILNTRIEQAKLLLRTTDKKAYEIAEAVGIYDPVYFSKIFKKVTGVKPKEYRSQTNGHI